MDSQSPTPAWEAFRRLQRLEGALARELQDRCDLSPADYDVLDAVATHAAECVRVGALADAMSWARPRLSRQLARMERRGLIGREPCERDGRGDDVVLTADGTAALSSARPVHREWVRGRVEAPLSERDRAALRRIAGLLVPD